MDKIRTVCPFCGFVEDLGLGHCGESSGHMIRVRTGHEDPIVGGWYAYDEDRYDGAPDGYHVIGRGATEKEAISDLLELTEERAS